MCSAFGYHEREGDEGAVGDAFGTILTVENAVVVHKPKEQSSGDSFISVTEGMVLGDEIEQHGSLLLYTGIEVHTVEGLIDLPDGALERVVLLVAEERGVAELLFQHIDFLHSVLVGGMKGLLSGGLADAQPLIVVVVEGVERIGIVDDDLEDRVSSLCITS